MDELSLALRSVTQDGFSLQHLPFYLCADSNNHDYYDIVLAAVTQNGDGLEFVADILRSDKEQNYNEL